MATITAQRDLVSSKKRETFLNISIISKIQPLPADLKQFNSDTLEKLTQNVFNHLSYYLVSIVDPTKAASLSWPLYDSKTERAYRNELSSFIAVYSGKGLISPVMSSYLVNPGCYKVTVFMWQLSQLAVQQVLKSIMRKDHQKNLYNEMTQKYKSQENNFMENIEGKTEFMLQKFSNYLQKKEIMEKMADRFKKKIKSMEDKLSSIKAQCYINNLVDDFEDKNSLDENMKPIILEIKNVAKPAKFFDLWLEYVDHESDHLETKWDSKMSPLLKSGTETMDLTKALIGRQTGEADKSLYMIEYHHKTDEISTRELEEKVNSQQKYILKNIVKDDRQSLPNLVRSFVIAVSYILKSKEIGEKVYQFNEYVESGNKKYMEMVEAMKVLLERVMTVESRLEPSPLIYNQSISIKDIAEIPPLPDLSGLSTKQDTLDYFSSFTPLGLTKHQFNLRKSNAVSFLKPQNRSFAYHQAPRDDFLKNFISGHMSYDRQSSTHIQNLSMISHAHMKSNETIAECSSGFTKQQIQRLLSTKKSSSTKKHKFKTDRPLLFKKGALFNVSNTSSENGLFRCHSSPDLFENKEKPLNKLRRRKLSIMQEGSPTLLEVSGIMALEKEQGLPEPGYSESTPKLVETTPLPTIFVTPAKEKCTNLFEELEIDLNKEISNVSKESGIASMEQNKMTDLEAKETPKSKIPVPVKKTSSIEKIINRFKKVRASVLPQEVKETELEIRTIVEEKENLNTVNTDVFTANKVLLPDLLSPSCSLLTIKSSDYLDEFCNEMDKKDNRKARESLGTVLGVDQTVIDQFDLID